MLSSETGGPLCGDNFRSRVFYKLIELADVPRFHDIWHAFAGLLLSQCEPVHYIKEQTGHASIQTTLDVHGHLVPGSNQNDATVPNEVFARHSPTQPDTSRSAASLALRQPYADSLARRRIICRSDLG